MVCISFTSSDLYAAAIKPKVALGSAYTAWGGNGHSLVLPSSLRDLHS